MKPIHLPPALVRWINALDRGEDPSELLPEVRAYTRDTRTALEAQSDHFISSEDAVDCDNLRLMLDGLERLADGDPTATQAADAAFALISILRKFSSTRTRTYFVDIPAFDALLVAMIATLQGRGSLDAVRVRIPAAEAALRALESDFSEEAARHPEEIRQAVRNGFATLQAGLQSVTDSLESAARQVKAGAEAASAFARWRSAARARAAEQMALPRVPVGALPLAMLLEPCTDWRARADLFADTVLGQIQTWWDARASALLPAPDREDPRPAVDDAMQQLSLALAGDGSELPAAVTALEEALAAAQASEMRLEGALGGPLEPVAETIAGAYTESIPDLVLREVAEVLARPDSPPRIQEAAGCIQQALVEGERGWLLTALALVLQEADAVRAGAEALTGDLGTG
ncbi:MAG: hypothetical protein FJX76_24665 [Armatimonadetes bacterium]|nr:hypothetical protein [Armatimonadota bacterium]